MNILKRLEEPSTWAGIGLVVSQLSTFFTGLPHDVGTGAIIVAAFSGVIAILTKEGVV